MNRRKSAFFAALCLAVLLTAGCALFSDDSAEPEFTLPPLAENTDSADDGELTAVGQEPETPGIKLNSDELKSLNRMFFASRNNSNWYYRSIPVQWTDDNPCNINIGTLFYNGIDGDVNNFTKDEIAWLSVQTGISEKDISEMGQYRLSEAKMDYVLREYYGITFNDSYHTGFGSAIYRSDTGCYYMIHNDEINARFGLHSAYEQDDGSFIIYYGSNEKNPAPEYVMALAPNDFGSYTILYNKSVTEE